MIYFLIIDINLNTALISLNKLKLDSQKFTEKFKRQFGIFVFLKFQIKMNYIALNGFSY